MEDSRFLIDFGEQIKLLRKKRKLSHRELSLRSELEKSTVVRIEKGKMNPSAIVLIKLCKGLTVPIEKLFKFLPKDYYKES